jgi:peptidoglycan hydrolase CwlO-like protein
MLKKFSLSKKILLLLLGIGIGIYVIPNYNIGVLNQVRAQEENEEEEEEENTEDGETEISEETQGEIEDLQEKIQEYEEKIDSLGKQKNSLKKEIEYADSQVQLTQLRIQNTTNQIAQKTKKIEELGEDIEDLSYRIDRIAESIEYQRKILGERKRSYYKMEQSTPQGLEFLLFLIDPSQLEKKVQKTTYSQVMQERDNELLEDMNKTKTAYANQKGIFEDKKEEEEKLKAEIEVQRINLESYKRQLDNQKASKERLLVDTQNSEEKYQELLEEAREELESYKTFVQNAGGSVVGAGELGSGEEGWYLSQRDSRWANERIGNSSYTLFESGCLVTSVTMIHNRYGHNITPANLADHDAYFIFGSMRIPWPAPSGKSYKLLSWGYNKDKIENELDDNNPVIVGVHANNAAGTHFLVLSEEDDGDYIMYDPWYGPDLKFSDYYSTSSIFEAVAFK